MKTNYIIDFDSTFTQVEALDELAKISLKNNPDRQQHLADIAKLTNLAMDGQLSFRESLIRRVQLLHANREHLEVLIKKLKKKVSASFSRNKEFFKDNSKDVYIVSGGFKEFIWPVVANYHISEENVYANTFLFDNEGNICGFDEKNPLSEEGGKVKLLKKLKLEGKVYGIGDGYSDFQLKESGMIEKFYAFTENIERASVSSKADHIAPTFDEFLYINKLPRAISYPKNRIKCYVIGDVPHHAIKFLEKDGFSTIQLNKIDGEELSEAGMILFQDGITFTNEQIEKVSRLKTIGYLGNSKHKIDKKFCLQKGIVLFDDKKDTWKSAEFIPKRMADFINNGDTKMSRNFPNLKVPLMDNAHRLIHIHENIPGIMAQINGTFRDNNVNIVAQFLMTKSGIGYVITDISRKYDKKLLTELKSIKHTIKFRVLY
jgi:D-3-phosphoglycerate dehydrogenase